MYAVCYSDQASGFRVEDSFFWVSSLGSLGFRVYGFRVYGCMGLGFRLRRVVIRRPFLSK